MTELELLQKKIRQHMNDMADAIATGGAADFCEYKKMVGIIEGLAVAEREVLDLIEKFHD